MLIQCPGCQMQVWVKSNGQCPSCGKQIPSHILELAIQESASPPTILSEENASQPAFLREEFAKLRGTWVLIETSALGKTIGEETLSKGPPITLTIEGNTYQDRFKGTFEIDPTKTPKWLDRFPPSESTTGSRKQLCIYQFEGERLRIRSALPSSPERPTDFATTDNYVTFLYARIDHGSVINQLR